jgi:hypothetical protein
VSAGYLGFFSLLVAGSKSSGSGTYSFEFVVLVLTLILATPFFARDYMNWKADPVAERLAWLRSMPIDISTIVRARALAILTALPLNAVAFFLPVALFDQWSMAAADFAWLVISILGLSLIGAGITLYLELRISLRRWMLLNIVTMVAAMIAMVALGLWAHIRIFEQLTHAVEWNGPLAAAICVTVGVVGLVVLERLAEQALCRRELGA